MADGMLTPWTGANFTGFYNYNHNTDREESQGDLNNVIDPGNNDDFAPAEPADIRWRQRDNNAANFVFPDGHTETRTMDAVRNRNVRIDR